MATDLRWDNPAAIARRRPPPRSERVCDVDGCSRIHCSLGFCLPHYRRFRRYGNPLLGKPLSETIKSEPRRTPCQMCGGPKPPGHGLRMCDPCHKARLAERRIRNRPLHREYQLKRKYGLSIEDYNDLLTKQGGVCAICKGLPSKSFRWFAVDHDHQTGLVRGLLCQRCNGGLGYIESEFHAKALTYLEEAVRWP